MSITDAIYQGIRRKIEDVGKSVHFAVGDYNPIHIDEQYFHILPTHSAHTRTYGGVPYSLKQYKRLEKDYPTSDEIAAKRMFEKDVEKAAFLIELDSDDLALVYNMVRNPGSVDASQSKKLVKNGTGGAINHFTKKTFNTDANIGGAIANAMIKDSKHQNIYRQPRKIQYREQRS